GSWYYYPAVAVDQNENVVITFSRSGSDEYPGAYYITKQKDSGLFINSKVLRQGFGNYIEVGTGDRNRWGDYNGIWNDPVDINNIWLFTEFSARTNTWGTWVGNIRLTPYNKANILSSDTLLDFGARQIGTTSEFKRVLIKNIGYETLQISEIRTSNTDFKIITPLNYPINIATYDSLVLDIIFNPTEANIYDEKLEIISNAENNTSNRIYLKAEGYLINPVIKNSIYGLGELNTELIIINEQTGAGTSLGLTNVKGLVGLAVNPLDGVLYALQDPFYSTNGLSSLHHLNASAGSAYYLFNTDLALSSSCFDNNGNLYAATKDGSLYKIDITTGSYALIDSLGIPIASIAINPVDQQMWASIGQASTIGKDLIFKINKDNGETTFVGNAGTGTNTINALAFGNDGTLYGSIGSNAATLTKIDTKTGLATNIGAIGFKRVRGLALLPDSLTSIGTEGIVNNLPDKFYLKQNYPNPFNPNTTIEYALPYDAEVKLSVFNIIGQQIKILVSENQRAGVHKIRWSATDIDNIKLTSGVYFYRITALDKKGNEFKDIKKMILLK
ncbi:MAG: T9SS C-terminal target domain-containing protein, partial [Ignavibacteriales bacterium]